MRRIITTKKSNISEILPCKPSSNKKNICTSLFENPRGFLIEYHLVHMQHDSMEIFLKMKMEVWIPKGSVVNVDWGRVLGCPFPSHGRKNRRKINCFHDIRTHVKGWYFSRWNTYFTPILHDVFGYIIR